MNTSDRLITKDDVAERCHCNRRTIDNWVRDGKIPYTKIGRLIRFDWERVQRALERFTRKAVGE